MVPSYPADLVPDDSYILEMGFERLHGVDFRKGCYVGQEVTCLLYTSDAADERSSVDLGGRRIIKKKNKITL